MMAVFVMPVASFAAMGGTLFIGGNPGISLAADQSGTGWDWDSATDTLTLESTYGGDNVSFSTSDTIHVTYSGNVTITGPGTLQALVCDGEFIITGGGGTLTLIATNNFEALWALDAITIGGDAVINAKSDASAVIVVNDGDITIEGNASVTAEGTGVNSGGLYAGTSGSITINTTGDVDITATGVGYALEAAGDIDIMNGTVDLTAADDAHAYDPTPTFTGGMVTVNGTVVYVVLTFTGSPTYDIPASTVGTDIAEIDVSGGASGGTPPYTFSATGLPAGITISAAGVISGAPTAEDTAGTATVTVTDSAAVPDSKSITINYGAISDTPVPPPVDPLVFADSTDYDIPASTVGTAIVAIDVSDGVSGGTPPYVFSATGFPAGITISDAGVISGVPTAAGAAGTATVTVTDSAAAPESKSITINYGVVSAASEPGKSGGGGGCDAGFGALGALGLVLFLAERKRRA